MVTIGRFARLCRLSVKQLRHYDELGLLTPARVDVGTGYRYYAPEQARDALTIALLRDLDVPLAVIGAVLAADDPSRAGILRAERDRLAERIARDRTRLQTLERLVDDGLPGYEVRLGTEPERHLAVVRTDCALGDLAEAFQACLGRLMAGLADAGVPAGSPLCGLYPLDLVDPLRIAVGVPAPPSGAPGVEAAAFAGGPDVEITVLAGGPVAETVHVGPYTGLPMAYNALLSAIHQRGLLPCAPVREVYLAGPGQVPGQELRTRVIVPVMERAA